MPPFFVIEMSRPNKFFAGTHTKELAKMIANEFGESLSESSVVHFSDGEFEPSYDETVRGANVFF